MATTPKPLPWMFRSPKITVPANGTTNYTINLPTMAGNGEPFYRVPSVVVSVEGSSTVRAVSSAHSELGFVITLRNDFGAAQPVRFNAISWDAYAGDATA